MTKYILACILSLSCVGMSIAQEDQPEGQTSLNKPAIRHELGVAAGFTTGFGPAYRIWVNRLGAQTCFTPINDGSMELYSAGLSLMFSLAKTETSNFYLYQGNHFLSQTQYRSSTYEYVYQQDGSGNVSYTTVFKPAYTEKKNYFNNGFGIGIELFHKDRNISPFGFNLQCGLAGYRNFTRSNFTGEIALMYKFK